MKQILVILVFILALASCEVREEYTFNKDGSGTYEMGFDMTEFMNMGEESDTTSLGQEVDTLMNFASFLDEKRDSISQLSKEEQDRLEILRPLQIKMVMSDSTKQMLMELRYAFKDLKDLDKFSDAIEQANVKELNEFTPSGGEEDASADNAQDQPDIFSMAESFDTHFSREKFSRKITEEARQKAIEQKDTTMVADDPFADMVRFKQVFHFPYKVKSVDNERVRILPDFKGVELEANMYDLNNNPDFFNIEVIFE